MTPKNIILAEYFTTDEVTLLFGVHKDWDEPKVVEIKQSLSEIRKYVKTNFSTEEIKDAEGKRTAYERMHDLDLDEWQARFSPFVEPILEWAERDDYVYLVPHDVLHYLPLHTLKVDGEYFIERNPILYTPSASVLKYCQAKRTGRLRKNILVLGDSASELPLPNARSEALEVARIFDTQPYLGQDARKSLVRGKLEQEKDQIDILHFACHGKFHRFQPLKSGILMAPESDGEEKTGEFETELDGLPFKRFLTAEDFFGMEMHADLVTLSACESGVNDIRPGDELFGFMRALIYAGTPSVVMSLWKVADISTELFMVRFYERLKLGDTKVEALQKAQLYIKSLTAGEAKVYYENKVSKSAASDDFHQQQANEANQFIYRELLKAEGREGHPVGLDYQIFDHPYYWAPFILVGDWK